MNSKHHSADAGETTSKPPKASQTKKQKPKTLLHNKKIRAKV
ncbi:hypothetical protein [Paraburkholderia terrae]|nr:hypothetical protein [Paraburkholderia terrae]